MDAEQFDIPVFPIGTAARILGVSDPTLRLYEREGLLLTYKTRGKQRLYSQNDIERIVCIRKAINEEKISIGGMKRIHGMVPCWEIIKCSDDERTGCPVFENHSGGCWTYKHLPSACATKECRRCDVYKLSGNCEQIKDLIVRSTLSGLSRHSHLSRQLNSE